MNPLDAQTAKEIIAASGEAAAIAAVRKFVTEHPHFAAPPVPPKAEIPSPLKWAAIVVTAIMTLSATGMAAWMVTTLNELQLTVARIDTRQMTDTTGKRLDAVEKVNSEQNDRITTLEGKAHQ